MSKTKSIEVPHYEILYIISNKFTEDEAKGVVEKIKKTLADNHSIVTHEEEWGKKKLSYPIKGQVFGYYNLVEIDSTQDDINKINRYFRLSSDILRHMTIAKKKKTVEEIEQEKKIAAKIAQGKEKAEEAKVVKEKAKKDKKVDLKDLDKKLDQILDTQDLL